MTLEVDAFLEYWPYDSDIDYDIEDTLWSWVDVLKDDLGSNDLKAREYAEKEIALTLEWLLPPLKSSKSRKVRQKRLASIVDRLKAAGFTSSVSRRMAKPAAELTGRRPGHPRTKAFLAVQALTLHLKTDKSWREIAFYLRKSCRQRKCKRFCAKCEDVNRETQEGSCAQPRRLKPRCTECNFVIRSQSQKQRVCYQCADAIRDLAGGLDRFLRARGLNDFQQETVDSPMN